MTEDRPVGRAAFLGGLLGFIALVAFSVVGIGHARTLEGDANLQYWIVVALVTAALAGVTGALSQHPARTRTGEVARKIGVAVAGVGTVLFVWETVALGLGGEAQPVAYALQLLKG